MGVDDIVWADLTVEEKLALVEQKRLENEGKNR